MKKLSYLFLCVIGVFFLCSCSNDGINDEITEEKEYLKIQDIEGIWTLKDKSLYFISLSLSGHYTLCFNNEIMGSGTFILEDDFIVLNNGYLYASDKLKVRKENNILSLNGKITTYLIGEKNINLNFIKSNEKISPSVVGKVLPDNGMTGLNKYYDELESEVTYMTNYTRWRN